jgi:aspartate/glutamate racemase
MGFLHTADVHVETFGRLAAELAPDLPVRHLVDESLLADARAGGLTPDQADARTGSQTTDQAATRSGGITTDLAGRVRDRLAELAAGGAGLIVCTCSTIGAVAEASAVGVPVMRADRPMAEAAVATGKRIGVMVTTESTLEPTLDLIRESATRAGAEVTLTAVCATSAWPFFESGELDRYYAEIADAARGLTDVDVIVLAQASMTPAADLITGVPVLTSPRSAVTAAVARSQAAG